MMNSDNIKGILHDPPSNSQQQKHRYYTKKRRGHFAWAASEASICSRNKFGKSNTENVYTDQDEINWT